MVFLKKMWWQKILYFIIPKHLKPENIFSYEEEHNCIRNDTEDVNFVVAVVCVCMGAGYFSVP